MSNSVSGLINVRRFKLKSQVSKTRKIIQVNWIPLNLNWIKINTIDAINRAPQFFGCGVFLEPFEIL